MMNTMASTTSTGNNASSSGEENTAETKRRSLILSGATSGSGQVQMIGNMLKVRKSQKKTLMSSIFQKNSKNIFLNSTLASNKIETIYFTHLGLFNLLIERLYFLGLTTS